MLPIRTLRVPARLASQMPTTDQDVVCRARLDPVDAGVGMITSFISDEEPMHIDPPCQGM